MSAEPEQVLIIEPQHELKFRGPFNIPVTSHMSLTNPGSEKVFFKIKTTAPKKYCVRPNSGVIAPKGKVEIAISLQPFTYDPNDKNKHKFMVQSVVAPKYNDDAIDQVWKEIQPDQLMDSKLKCVFEMPPGEAAYDVAMAKLEEAKAAAPAKAPSKGQGNQGVDEETLKILAEAQQLRDNFAKLREENLQLKEENLRLLRRAGGDQISQHSYAPKPTSPMASHLTIAAFAVVILGILIGKFIL